MNLIKQLTKLNTSLPVIIFQLNNGVRIVGLCIEQKKTFSIYSPMVIITGVNEQGQELVKLASYMPSAIVEAQHTILSKNHCQIFLPSENFKTHYLSRLLVKPETKKDSSTAVVDAGASKETSNVIDFVKFRAAKSNQSNSSSNTDPSAA